MSQLPNKIIPKADSLQFIKPPSISSPAESIATVDSISLKDPEDPNELILGRNAGDSIDLIKSNKNKSKNDLGLKTANSISEIRQKFYSKDADSLNSSGDFDIKQSDILRKQYVFPSVSR